MRIRELRLIRYGRFTDHIVDLPAAAKDIHLIVGPNEAGKSTLRRAISDWLFGIPARTPMGFLHPMQELQIGGVLERDDRSATDLPVDAIDSPLPAIPSEKRLDFERRKGNRNTLRTPTGSSLADSVLHGWLGNLQADSFNRMYALDHTTLVAGSEDILKASNDIGRMLFQAAAGIGHLGEALKNLQEEADQLWAPRKSDKRLYYQFQDTYDQARQSLTDSQLRARDWKTKHEALTETGRMLDEARHRLRDIRQQTSQLERIRRVQPLLRAWDAAQQQHQTLAAEGMPPLLPEDARQIFQAANQENALAQAQADRLQADLATTAQQLGRIQPDQQVLALADDISRLNDARLQYHDYPARLQKAQDTLRALWTRATGLAGELGWPAGDEAALTARLPAPSMCLRLGELLDRYSTVRQALELAQRDLAGQEQAIAQWQQQLQSLPAASLDPGLASLVGQLGKLGDHQARESALRHDIERFDASLNAELAQMGRWRPANGQLSDMMVPEATQVERLLQQHRDDSRLLQDRQQALADKIQDIRQLEQALDQLVRHHQPVSREEVNQARTLRDASWQDIKADPGALATRSSEFESQIKQADTLADARLERAQHEAERQASNDRIMRQKLEQSGIEAAIHAIEQRIEQRQLDWQALATTCGLPQLPLDMAPAWIQLYQRALQWQQEKQAAQRQYQAHQASTGRIHQELLQRLGYAPDAAPALDECLRLANERIRQSDRISGQRDTLDNQIQQGRQRLVPLQAQVTKANNAWQDWQTAWHATLTQTGHAPDTAPEQLEVQLDRMQSLQTLLEQIESLRRDGLDPLQAALADWTNQARMLARTLMPGSAPDTTPQDIALTLARRLETARQAEAEHQKLHQHQERDRQDLHTIQTKQLGIAAQLQPLLSAAATDSIAQLGQAIERSEQRRHIEKKIQDSEQALIEAGDGQTLEAIRAEANSIDPEQLQMKLDNLQADAERVTEEISQLSTRQGQQQTEFDAIDGNDAAARAAMRQQQAAASMADTAERYLRLKTAARLLAWSIDRFREARQGPMLIRASDMFAQLTLDSFSRLLVDADHSGTPRLLGIRQDSKQVAVEGMSEGTRDQLYLALRLAALDHQASQGQHMPLIADDLFINFDDRRTQAGLKVLGEISRRMQVIFLTHHAHLLPLARDVLGDRLNVVTL